MRRERGGLIQLNKIKGEIKNVKWVNSYNRAVLIKDMRDNRGNDLKTESC